MAKKYSVIIPVYNEFETIPILYDILFSVMEKLEEPYEIIFINDGSKGADMNYLRNRMDMNVTRIIDLPKHIGQTGALVAGFKEAQGEIVISMDGDLQDNPKYIPDFIRKLYQGFDVVCGYRVKRMDRRGKILLSKIGNFLQKIILRVNIHDISCTYRIYKRECVEDLGLIRKGYHRYIPFFVIKNGYKVTEIPVEQGERVFGRSKYSFWKVIEIVIDFFFLIFDVFIMERLCRKKIESF